MDLNILISGLQLAIALLQLRLDHFDKPHNRQQENQLDRFYILGEAIRRLEFALTETIAYIGQGHVIEQNLVLANLWENASVKVREVQGASEIADIAFEKNLYWRNPNFYQDREASKIYWISLDNVLSQLRTLRGKYERLQRKINL